MKKSITFYLLNVCMYLSIAGCAQVKNAQSSTAEKPWNNKEAAIVLTYDDALFVHLYNAIPALDSQGFKGTFYLCDNIGQMHEQMSGWKAAAANGHELGNHTTYHPCAGGKGREWVKPEYDLNRYTVRRINEEIRSMNTLLFAIDGKVKRTFAFPCSDKKIVDTPYINDEKIFVASRAVRGEIPTIDQVNLIDVPAYGINGNSTEELIQLVQQAIEKKGLLVFLFHGVGGEHSLDVSLEAHSKLLKFIKQQEDKIWVAPMIHVAEYVNQKQQYQAK